ncbi:hypothetical protein D3C78_938910 [compost metagenome]
MGSKQLGGRYAGIMRHHKQQAGKSIKIITFQRQRFLQEIARISHFLVIAEDDAYDAQEIRHVCAQTNGLPGTFLSDRHFPTFVVDAREQIPAVGIFIVNAQQCPQ